MYKACSKCGRIHEVGKRCFIGVYARKRDDKSKDRNTYAWRKKRDAIKKSAGYLCEVCRDEGRYVYDDLEVHHIIKLHDAPERLLDDTNLICLCTRCHKKADAGEIVRERLFLLARKRNEGIPPGV